MNGVSKGWLPSTLLALVLARGHCSASVFRSKQCQFFVDGRGCRPGCWRGTSLNQRAEHTGTRGKADPLSLSDGESLTYQKLHEPD